MTGCCLRELPLLLLFERRFLEHYQSIPTDMRSYTTLTRRAFHAVVPRSVAQQRCFTVTAQRPVRHTGQSPEEVEKSKQEQLKKQEQGKGEWHEDLASSSETHVKADREEVKDHDDHIEKLQDETAKQAEKEKR
ncbi:hypothetical protein AMS68_006947 [Peltaster fructicola]|uniref:Uncharacterized protein n=1 Tax=Peltaster fructicola TaxID=286661 RepID=A0A6H0Y488_9PEZI|nr:hypothetical protein AMS68_006947 [Peltaster fructicola]